MGPLISQRNNTPRVLSEDPNAGASMGPLISQRNNLEPARFPGVH